MVSRLKDEINIGIEFEIKDVCAQCGGELTIPVTFPEGFENILQHYSDILEERKKAEKEEMKEQGFDEKKYDPGNMMCQAQKSMPKVPMPSFTMPKL